MRSAREMRWLNNLIKGDYTMKAGNWTKAALVLMVSLGMLLSACGKNAEPAPPEDKQNNSNKPAVGQADDATPYNFTFYMHYDWAVTDVWGQDPVTQWIIENKKIHIEPIQSGGAAEAKLNTMIASKSLPDMIQMERGPGVDRLQSAGTLVALDEYLDKYPNLKEQIGEETLNMLRSSDGKLYQIPNWFTSTPNGNSGWMINKKIYEQLGSPKLETFDDLHAYLSQVKAAYPDVVPLEIDTSGVGFGIIYAGFKEENAPHLINHTAYVDNGELKPIFNDPVYREALLYTSELFRERLISQDALTQSLDQMKERLHSGRVAVYAGGDTANVGRDADAALKQADPESGYIAIWPIHKEGLDKNRITPSSWNSLGWNVNIITKNAKDPEKIIAYLDWLVSPEGQRIVWWGPEGIMWEQLDEDGYPVLNEKWVAATPEDKKGMKLEAFNITGNTTFIDTAKVKLEKLLPEGSRNWATEAQGSIFWKSSMNVTEFINIDPSPESAEGIAAQSSRDLYNQTFSKALFAANDDEVNGLLDKGLADLKKVNLDSALQFKTTAWYNNKKMIEGN
ncbi:extracellular solute-binding protein [Paenibacillaceae bacterium]|nr:extracellular solute-binding protein [Paenibacillaceae bacterium]